MAKNQTVRIRPIILKEDLNALTALQAFASYTPVNSAYSKTALTAKLTAMKAAQDAEFNAKIALGTARDAATAAEWDLHNLLLGAKDQVIAQYGKDSDQIQSMGLKKKSERKSPARKKSA